MFVRPECEKTPTGFLLVSVFHSVWSRRSIGMRGRVPAGWRVVDPPSWAVAPDVLHALQSCLLAGEWCCMTGRIVGKD
jgi:hypothetical protein